MNSLSFQPLLFGGDINVYSMARAFHQAYGITSIAYGKYPAFPCCQSAILDYRVCPENEDPAVFRRNVTAVAQAFPQKTILLVGCGDSYVQLAAHCHGQLPSNVHIPYVEGQLLDRLIHKEHFYEICRQYGIPHPKTFIYDQSMGQDFTLPFGPPYIAKPANSVAYWATGVSSLAKVYRCETLEELWKVLGQIYQAGYSDHMILQEFIPGDDTHMRVLTNYSDRHGKVKMMCLGHVLLEEHSPHGIGNHAVILTDYDPDLCAPIQTMLEGLHFSGFSNFDIKYDPRDGQYKVFELNCRQGRSNYYVTGTGVNLARLLVEDRIEQQDLPFQIVNHPILWRMIPRHLAFTFIPKSYHQEMRRRIAAGEDVHPLLYGKDASCLRLLRIFKNHLGNFKRFYQYNQPPQA